MRLTRERKIILVVLAVAATALLFDQLLSGSPATGPAAAQADSTSPAPAEDTPQAKSPTVSQIDAEPSDRQSVAQQLAGISQMPELAVAQITDAFRPSSEWESGNLSTDTQAAKVLPGRAGEVFASEHTLSGVIKTDSGGYAIINGQVVGLGHTLGGFKLVATSDNSVRMESNGVRVVLRLDRSASPTDRQRSAPAGNSPGSADE